MTKLIDTHRRRSVRGGVRNYNGRTGQRTASNGLRNWSSAHDNERSSDLELGQWEEDHELCNRGQQAEAERNDSL